MLSTLDSNDDVSYVYSVALNIELINFYYLKFQIIKLLNILNLY